MNNKPFVSNKISRLLKEKGFDLQCMACYDKLDMLSTYSESIFVTKNYNTSGYVCSAPLYQQVVDWFREKHKIFISVDCACYDKPERYAASIAGYGKMGIFMPVMIDGFTIFDDYYMALDDGIEEALKLI